MTAPTKNRFEASGGDVVKPKGQMRPITLTNEFAVDHLISLLHEFIAQGALPAL